MDEVKLTKEQEIIEQIRTLLLNDVSNLLFEQVQSKHLVKSLFAGKITNPGNAKIETAVENLKNRMLIITEKIELSMKTIEQIDNNEFNIEEYLKKE